MLLEILWCVVASIGLMRGTDLLHEAVVDRRALGEVQNGRRIIANAQVEEAWMGVCIYFFLLAPGALALAYHLGLTSLKNRLSLVPFFLVAALLMLFFRQERRAFYRRKLLAGGLAPIPSEQIDNIEETTQDTNARVTEMQERGQSDQPLEQTDRSEGHTHRAALEDAVEADRIERKEERRLDREERATERQDDREERARNERRLD